MTEKEKQSRGKYQDIKFEDFSGGLATRVEDNKIADNQSPSLQNVIFDGKGSIMPRLGMEAAGAATSTEGKIRRAWVTTNTRNEEIVSRQADDGTNCWIEYYNPQTAAWENLDAGYSSGYDFSNAYYDYYTYYSSVKDHQRRWNGVCWSTSTYADSGYSRIDLSTSAASSIGFLSAGSIVLDGEEIYYSARVSTTGISGCTILNAHDGGVAIAQLPTSAGEVPAVDSGWVSASNLLPKGGVMYEMDAQIFVTAASGVSGNVVYYSAVDEPTNYKISAVAGGGGTVRYPEASGSVTALTDFDEVLTVFKKDAIRKLMFEQFGTTSGTTEIVNRRNIITAPKIGAISHKGLAKVENDTVYVTPSGWVKSLSLTDAGRKSTELSVNIRPTVESYNMLSAAGKYFDGNYYLACASPDATLNDTVLVWDYEYNAWTKFVGWNVSDWYIYENALYYGASNEIKTYKALVNYDDATLPYETYWSSKWLDFGIPNEQKRLGIVYIEGYCTQNTNIGVSAYFDGNSNSPVSKTIDGDNSDYVTPSETITVIGYNTWGKGIYGGGGAGTAFRLRKFRWFGRYSGKNLFNMQVNIGTASPGYVYKVTHIVPYLMQIPGKRIPIKSLI